MRKRESLLILKIVAAVIVSFIVFFWISYELNKGRTGETDITETEVTENNKPETRSSETSVTPVPTVTLPPETSSTSSETTKTSETTAFPRLDIGQVKDAWVYSVWYDAVESNPADYDTIEKSKAFALKGVFYFNTPLTAEFETRLYKDDTLLLTGEVRMKDNVTAEADFSAGLAGIGNFEAGEYYIELLYNGETVAVTSVMRVR